MLRDNVLGVRDMSKCLRVAAKLLSQTAVPGDLARTATLHRSRNSAVFTSGIAGGVRGALEKLMCVNHLRATFVLARVTATACVQARHACVHYHISISCGREYAHECACATPTGHTCDAMQVPFDSDGWRCCINMYLRLCARPRGLVRGLGGGGTSGAAPGNGWEQAPTGHRQQPRDHQQHHGMTGWSGGSGYASQGHVGGASRSDSPAATPFASGYQGMSQAPMQQVPAPAYAQQGWPQQPQQPQPPQPSQSPQGWAAPTQQAWAQQPQPQQQMSPSVAAAFAAAAAAAAAASSQEAPAAKRQALQGAWAGYNHGFESQEGQTPLQGGAVPPSVQNSNVADVSYSQGFVGGGGGRGAHSTLEQTPFASGDLPSDVPDRRPADEGTQRDNSMDVPPSTDFSELFDSMFKE